MAGTDVIRSTLVDGRWQLAAGKSRFLFERLRPGSLLVSASGSDTGQFGTAVLDEVRAEAMRFGPVRLFVDATGAQYVAVEVSREWTKFFSTNRNNLRRVSVLVGSRAMQLTVAIAQHLSSTGSLVQIYTDPDLFYGLVNTERVGGLV